MAKRTRFRRIRRNQNVDIEFINELYENDKALDAAIEGLIGSGTFVEMRASYELSDDGTTYILVNQTGNGIFPQEIKSEIVGELTINFSSAIPDDTYHVELTAGVDSVCRPGIIGYGARSMGDKTATSITIWMRTGGVEDTPINLTGFTIAISYGA